MGRRTIKPRNDKHQSFMYLFSQAIVSKHKLYVVTPSSTPPLKGGAYLLSAHSRGEGKGEGGLLIYAQTQFIPLP